MKPFHLIVATGLICSLALGLIFVGPQKLSAVPPAGGFTVKHVVGIYYFAFNGRAANASTEAVGVFTGDGNGKLVNGKRHIKLGTFTYRDQTFTCTLTVATSGLGEAECVLDKPVSGFPPSEKYAFILSDSGHMVNFFSTNSSFNLTGFGKLQ
jgi:hypothetical protein